MKKQILIFLSVLSLSGCGVSQSEYDKISSENAALKKELDELKYGTDRIVAEVESAYSAKRYSDARRGIKNLQDKHPESPKNAAFTSLLKSIEEEEAKEKIRAAAEEKIRKEKANAAEREKVRLANINNTGMWAIRQFVDKFGDKTKEKYITNKERIVGTFSNSATEDSPLGVDFLINSRSNVAIMLYEYGGDNPVKAISENEYSVAVLDRDGKELNYRAVNSSDRLHFKFVGYQENFHSAMIKGGVLKFRIRDDERSTTLYRFDVRVPDGYENALRMLSEGPR